MRKQTLCFCLSIGLLAGLASNVSLAEDADTAETFGRLAMTMNPTGANLTHRSSLLSDVTFGNLETPYDFFFQPWELPNVTFGETQHLGNRHDGDQGEYKTLYWSQLSNNGGQFTFSSPDATIGFAETDILTASALFHVGQKGFLGVSASIGQDDFETAGPGGSVTESETTLSEVYVTYARPVSDTLTWGVGVTLFGGSVDDKLGTAGARDEHDLGTFNVKGGVSLTKWDNQTWNFFGHFGLSEVERDCRTIGLGLCGSGGADRIDQELDGDTFGLGAEWNLYRGGYDLEFGVELNSTEYDLDEFSDTGGGFVATIQAGNVEQDSIEFRVRHSYELERMQVFHGIRILSAETESNPSSAVSSGFWEQDLTLIQLSSAVRFPLTSTERGVSISVLGGAAYTLSEIEETRLTNGVFDTSSPPFPVNPGETSNTVGETTYRLGLEARGERFVFELMWEEDDSSNSTSVLGSASRDRVRTDAVTVAVSFKL